jgi:hypothetical protein
VPDGDERTFLPTPGCDASVLGRQVGLPRSGRYMRHFHQHLAQPSIACTGLATEAFASTVVMPRAHARPGRQVLGIGEARHIRPNFGEEHLGRALTDSWNRIQERHCLPVRHQVLVNGRTDAVDRLIPVIDLAEGLR